MYYLGVMLERTGNQEGRLGEVFGFDCRRLDGLAGDSTF